MAKNVGLDCREFSWQK